MFPKKSLSRYQLLLIQTKALPHSESNPTAIISLLAQKCTQTHGYLQTEVGVVARRPPYQQGIGLTPSRRKFEGRGQPNSRQNRTPFEEGHEK
jgi:hypothetical protein